MPDIVERVALALFNQGRKWDHLPPLENIPEQENPKYYRAMARAALDVMPRYDALLRELRDDLDAKFGRHRVDVNWPKLREFGN